MICHSWIAGIQSEPSTGIMDSHTGRSFVRLKTEGVQEPGIGRIADQKCAHLDWNMTKNLILECSSSVSSLSNYRSCPCYSMSSDEKITGPKTDSSFIIKSMIKNQKSNAWKNRCRFVIESIKESKPSFLSLLFFFSILDLNSKKCGLSNSFHTHFLLWFEKINKFFFSHLIWNSFKNKNKKICPCVTLQLSNYYRKWFAYCPSTVPAGWPGRESHFWRRKNLGYWVALNSYRKWNLL